MAETKMTENSPFKHMVRYAVPLVLASAFQLFYNAADSIIAGRFIGREALAATGIASPIMNLLILSISGLSIGSGVLMSQHYGAGEEGKLKRALSTLLLFGLIFSVSVAMIGFILTEKILMWINTPEDIMPMSITYLRIIFLATPFTYFYNALSAALKSVGDSTTPLKFLLFSSILNLVLDIIFIGFLGFGIRCSATTTVIAEAVSALLSFYYIYRHVEILKIRRNDWALDGSMLKTIISYGSITALQQSVQPIGKLMIQSAVNSLGVNVIAAFNAVTRIDDFALTPEQSISHAVTTFTAQNLGAGKEKRIRTGLREGLMLEILYGIFIGLVVFAFKDSVMRLFSSDAESDMVIVEGVKYLSTMSLFYILPGLTNGIQGFMRGMGRMKTTLIATTIQVVLRVIFTFALIAHLGITAISLACAIGWIAMMIFEYPYAFFFLRKRKKKFPQEG